jgi:hypothetical protein
MRRKSALAVKTAAVIAAVAKNAANAKKNRGD